MKRTFVLRMEREPMTGFIQTRCEVELKEFYEAAGIVRGIDAADVVREVLRKGVKPLARRNPRLKPLARSIVHGT